MSFELNKGFIEQFVNRTEEELNKTLKEKNLTLYKMQEHGTTYVGYFSYDYFRVHVKVVDGIVVQADVG